MIIFDLDGTLLNTVKDLHTALNYALKQHNFPLKTEAETVALLGNGIDILVAGAIEDGKSNPKFEETYATFRKYYTAHLNDYTKPYDGIIELLTELKSRNVKMGIVSNKFDEGVKELTDKYFSGLISHAVGTSETIKKKPSPDAVFALIKELNAEKETNYYVGDSDVDINTANNANIPCISVNWGFFTRQKLEEIGAKIIIDTPKEILDII